MRMYIIFMSKKVKRVSFSLSSVGILWNLSSKDSLKERLARESLSELTERVLVPLSGGGDAGVIQQSASEADIFFNTTGCLRYSHHIYTCI